MQFQKTIVFCFVLLLTAINLSADEPYYIKSEKEKCSFYKTLGVIGMVSGSVATVMGFKAYNAKPIPVYSNNNAVMYEDPKIKSAAYPLIIIGIPVGIIGTCTWIDNTIKYERLKKVKISYNYNGIVLTYLF